MRVLVVEDDPLLAAVLQEFLGSAGHQVNVAPSGAVALRLFLDDYPRPEVLLTEAVLPDMQGWQVLDVCRTVVPGFPGVVLSDDPARGFRIETFCVTLQKPFDDDALYAALRAAVGAATP